MKKPTMAAGTSPFAHLIGGVAAVAGRALGRRAEDEQDDPNAEEQDDNDPAAEDDDADQPEKGNRGNKAEDENDDPDAEDEDKEPDAEDEDADEPEGKKAATPYQRGYAAANKRARAIFASTAAAGRPDLAAQLAFGSKLSAAEAIGVMQTASAGALKPRSALDSRMNGRSEARPGAGADTGSRGGKNSFADRLANARAKAGRA